MGARGRSSIWTGELDLATECFIYLLHHDILYYRCNMEVNSKTFPWQIKVNTFHKLLKRHHVLQLLTKIITYGKPLLQNYISGNFYMNIEKKMFTKKITEKRLHYQHDVISCNRRNYIMEHE